MYESRANNRRLLFLLFNKTILAFLVYFVYVYVPDFKNKEEKNKISSFHILYLPIKSYGRLSYTFRKTLSPFPVYNISHRKFSHFCPLLLKIRPLASFYNKSFPTYAFMTKLANAHSSYSK